MSWLPRFVMVGTTGCEPDGDYEGTTLQVFWHGWLLEIAFLHKGSGE